MFCADSSSWIAYLSGVSGADSDLIDSYLHDRSLRMAPVVLAELLSDPTLPFEAEKALLRIPLLELTPGYWERAGKTRADLIKRVGESIVCGKRESVRNALIQRHQQRVVVGLTRA